MNRHIRSPTRRIVAVGCIVALAAVGLAAAQTPTVDPMLDRRSLIDDGESPSLFMLQTGDVIGYLDPCG